MPWYCQMHLNAKLVGIHLTYQIGYAVILSVHLNAKMPLKITVFTATLRDQVRFDIHVNHQNFKPYFPQRWNISQNLSSGNAFLWLQFMFKIDSIGLAYSLSFRRLFVNIPPLGSRSEPTFCLSWSGSKLFAKVISRWQKLALALKEVRGWERQRISPKPFLGGSIFHKVKSRVHNHITHLICPQILSLLGPLIPVTTHSIVLVYWLITVHAK